MAAILLAAFELAKQPLDGEVVVALSAEEETGGQGIATILDQLGALDAAVVGEPTGLRVCAAQRGMLVLKCTARGQSGHVAHAQMLGAENAIHKAARDIAKIAAMDFPAHPLLGTQKAQVTQISGGLRRNQVPDACEFFMDLRTGPDQDHDGPVRRLPAAAGERGRHPLQALPAQGHGSQPRHRPRRPPGRRARRGPWARAPPRTGPSWAASPP